MSLYFPLRKLKKKRRPTFHSNQDESKVEIAFIDWYIDCVIISNMFLYNKEMVKFLILYLLGMKLGMFIFFL
jgi:hypothetical protein